MTKNDTTTTARPTFGLFQIDAPAELGGGPTACLGHNDLEQLDDLSPAQLRQLADDALAAAAWMEGGQ